MIEWPYNQGINRPHARRAECQQIAHRGKFQNKLSIQHHKHHPDKRNHTSENLPLAKPLALVNEPAKNHRQKRIRADDQRNIARWRKRKRCILRPEVKRATRKPTHKQNQFVLPVFATELFMRSRQKQQVRHHEPQRENLHRRKSVIQEHLRAHETRAPKEDSHDSENVPKGKAAGKCCRNLFHRNKR